MLVLLPLLVFVEACLQRRARLSQLALESGEFQNQRRHRLVAIVL